MKTLRELRAERAALVKKSRDFLESRSKDDARLSAEDDAAYSRMEDDLMDYDKQIERLERLENRESVLEMPVNMPLTTKPGEPKEDEKKGRAADSYRKAFWNTIRVKYPSLEITNALQEGVDSEGGYLIPDEYERTLIQALNEETAIRQYAKVITTSNGTHKIPIVASHGEAAWMEEEDAFQQSDETFGQVNLDAHKVGTLIKVSEELLNDSAFDLEAYMRSEFARRIGDKEEDAFLNGNGTHKPTGLLHETAGAQVGVTAASSTALTADELIDLFHSLKSPYRKKAVWIMNDSTMKQIRKLKDGNGVYLWQPGIRDGEVNTILGKPYSTTAFMPEIAAGAKTLLFGDLSYYWIADRQGIVFKRLNELFAGNGQVGFLAYKRLDGKTVLPEAIKVLKQKA